VEKSGSKYNRKIVTTNKQNQYVSISVYALDVLSLI